MHLAALRDIVLSIVDIVTWKKESSGAFELSRRLVLDWSSKSEYQHNLQIDLVVSSSSNAS